MAKKKKNLNTSSTMRVLSRTNWREKFPLTFSGVDKEEQHV